jgi:hypothetical protein
MLVKFPMSFSAFLISCLATSSFGQDFYPDVDSLAGKQYNDALASYIEYGLVLPPVDGYSIPRSPVTIDIKTGETRSWSGFDPATPFVLIQESMVNSTYIDESNRAFLEADAAWEKFGGASPELIKFNNILDQGRIDFLSQSDGVFELGLTYIEGSEGKLRVCDVCFGIAVIPSTPLVFSPFGYSSMELTGDSGTSDAPIKFQAEPSSENLALIKVLVKGVMVSAGLEEYTPFVGSPSYSSFSAQGGVTQFTSVAVVVPSWSYSDVQGEWHLFIVSVSDGSSSVALGTGSIGSKQLLVTDHRFRALGWIAVPFFVDPKSAPFPSEVTNALSAGEASPREQRFADALKSAAQALFLTSGE